MKLLIFISSLTFISFSFAQGALQQDIPQAFYDKKTRQPIIIYTNLNGEPIDTLYNNTKHYCWFQIGIQQSKKGWFQLDYLLKIPGCEPDQALLDSATYHGKWIRSNNFKINIQGLHETKIYTESKTDAGVVITVVDFVQCEVIDSKNNWLKVEFEYKGRQIIGWLKPADQCAYPWTVCS